MVMRPRPLVFGKCDLLTMTLDGYLCKKNLSGIKVDVGLFISFNTN